jgi:hypothetical protein
VHGGARTWLIRCAQLREEVVRGMRKGTTTEVRHAKKRLRRHEMYEERLSEQLERRQQQEKEHRERAVRCTC